MIVRLLLAVSIYSLASCRSLVPLQGKYQEAPVKESYNSKFDSVWDSVIDFISDTGQEVQLIDKGSGIIISDAHIANSGDMSHEDKRGRLINSNALVVIERYNDEFPRGEALGKVASAKWTIRVKRESDAVTSVAALLHIKSVTYFNPKLADKFAGKSTGNYERAMMSQIGHRVQSVK